MLFHQPLCGQASEGVFDRFTGESGSDSGQGMAWLSDLFVAEAPLEMELTADFTALSRQGEEADYLPGTLIVYSEKPWMTRINVRLKARGNARRKACAFPPLKIDFSHKGTRLTEVKSLDELKMVCHCREGEEYDRYVLKEYLVYKLYNVLTPVSFRVRLVRMTYVDSSSRETIHQGFAFLIEEVDALARRLNAREVKDDKLRPQDVDADQLSLVSVFQFMIGNLDWSVTNLHNVKLLNMQDRPAPVSAPYDFDFSGLVNAFYAERRDDDPPPPPRPGRVFQGYCRTPEELDAVLSVFRSHKTDLLTVVRNFPYLPDEEKSDMERYLLPFFNIIDSPQQVEAYLVRNCRR